jgi:GAF domain-containing protein/DNA-binding response OmpR family regulator/anti-sigma regulatory factor (Ser/Thr protein kinase)
MRVSRGAGGAKILHIEDNAENRALVRALLEAAGYTVVEAEDGLEGIEVALREEPALILLDINLPEVDGYEVGVLLKSFPSLSTTPVVAVTAYAMEGDRQRTLAAGCDGYIQKPIDVDAFPGQIAEFLRGRRERIEEREAAPYLRELNQRLVYRLVGQVEELRRLNQHFVRRARQLEELHAAMEGVTAELGVQGLLERLLPVLARALGSEFLAVELTDPPGVRVCAAGEAAGPARSPVPGAAAPEDWTEVEWTVGLHVRGRTLGVLTARHRLPAGAKPDEEQLLKVVATQLAIAVENARLYAAQREAAEISAGLLRLAEALEGAQALDQILDTVVRTSAELLGCAQCLLFLLEPGSGRLVPAVAAGLPEERRSVLGALHGFETLPAVARALEAQDPVVLEPVGADHPLAPVLAALEVRTMLVVPLVSGGRLMGVLAAHTPAQSRSFSQKEVALGRGIAAHAAVALDKARLFEQTQARLRETETLLAITQAVSSTLDPAEALRRVAREMARALGADTVGAYLADPEGHSLRPVAGYRVAPHLREAFLHHPIPVRGHPAVEEAWRTHHAVWTDDAPGDPRLDRETFARFPHQSLLFVPMLAKGGPVGGFFAIWWHRRRRLGPEEVRLVEAMSDQAAMFVENARLYAEAQRRRREAEELARLARMLTERLDAADVGERIVESALGLLEGTFSVLRLLEPDGALKLVTAKGDPGVVGSLPVVVPAGWGAVGRAVREGRPVVCPDVLADPGLDFPPEARERLAGLGGCAFLAVPLRVKRETIGALGVGAPVGRAFSEAEAALLQTFADQAAIALENSRLYGDLRAALQAVEESQQRIVQGERLRALGEMAGGVAHDFNNVLAIIVGRAEVLASETNDPELRRQLEVIIKVAMDAAQTVRRIQEFTRMRRARPFQQVNLTQVVEEMVDVTRSRWKDEAQARGIRYEMVVETAPTPPILGDPSEIREALTNIIFNALDAMPDGGRVTLRTGVEGDRVICTIADTGIGMSDEVRRRIFDPFFTTKGERGTGLGLSVVYGIMTRHNAEIDVRSRPGQGTTFVLKFPLGGEVGTETPPSAGAGARGPGRVLVIDDEPEIGAILHDLLRRDGHTVVVCQEAEAGLARLATEPFDVVITDLGMPNLSGWEIVRHAKRARPGTPVIMVTGWGDRVDLAEARARGVDFLVAKPFKRDQLRELVAAALSASGQPSSAAG